MLIRKKTALFVLTLGMVTLLLILNSERLKVNKFVATSISTIGKEATHSGRQPASVRQALGGALKYKSPTQTLTSNEVKESWKDIQNAAFKKSAKNKGPTEKYDNDSPKAKSKDSQGKKKSNQDKKSDKNMKENTKKQDKGKTDRKDSRQATKSDNPGKEKLNEETDFITNTKDEEWKRNSNKLSVGVETKDTEMNTKMKIKEEKKGKEESDDDIQAEAANQKRDGQAANEVKIKDKGESREDTDTTEEKSLALDKPDPKDESYVLGMALKRGYFTTSSAAVSEENKDKKEKENNVKEKKEKEKKEKEKKDKEKKKEKKENENEQDNEKNMDPKTADNVSERRDTERPQAKDRSQNPTKKMHDTSSEGKNTTIITHKHQQKYLIYVCNASQYCYGLGDRQRTIVSMYTLALATNRKFGIVWTQPCPVTQFLGPNEIKWDIPKEELKGKTTKWLKYLSMKVHMDLDTPFNSQYPEDIVYMQTNHNYLHSLKRRKNYVDRLPKWIKKTESAIFGMIWQKIMLPKYTIREPVNNMLVRIAQDMQLGDRLKQRMAKSAVCKEMCGVIQASLSDGIQDYYQKDKSYNISMDNCVQWITHFDPRVSKDDGLFPEGYPVEGQESIFTPRNMELFCQNAGIIDDRSYRDDNTSGNADEKWPSPQNVSLSSHTSIDSIRRSRGYDMVDLGLVCVHVRIGRSKGMPFDPSRNSVESTKVVWDFLQPYVRQGRHVYLATDYEQVRKEAKDQFGFHLHVSTAPIVHIATIRGNQDKIEGMRFALWEQLLLMVSCDTLVMSYSGYSQRAGMVRRALGNVGQRFRFKDGQVRKA